MEHNPSGPRRTARDLLDQAFDVVRGTIVCDSVTTVQAILKYLHSVESPFEIVRIKNRFQKPTDGGWADILTNCYLKECKMAHNHICEIQISHTRLTLVRADLGGNDCYSEFRSAREKLEALGYNPLDCSFVVTELTRQKRECSDKNRFKEAADLHLCIQIVEELEERSDGLKKCLVTEHDRSVRAKYEGALHDIQSLTTRIVAQKNTEGVLVEAVGCGLDCIAVSALTREMEGNPPQLQLCIEAIDKLRNKTRALEAQLATEQDGSRHAVLDRELHEVRQDIAQIVRQKEVTGTNNFKRPSNRNVLVCRPSVGFCCCFIIVVLSFLAFVASSWEVGKTRVCGCVDLLQLGPRLQEYASMIKSYNV
jgi:hypothetical protein